MPDTPWPISPTGDVNEAIRQLQRFIDELFQERVAGALLGDVFQVGDDDVLAINLADDGGLEKSDSELKIKVDAADGGLQLSADGIAIKLDTPVLLELGAGGLKVTNTKVYHVDEFLFNTGADPATELGYGTWELKLVGNLTLT